MKATARPGADATITLAAGGSWPIASGATRAAPRCCWCMVRRPGYGGSNARPDPSLLGWADDVQALADRLGLERLAVVGFSAGG